MHTVLSWQLLLYKIISVHLNTPCPTFNLLSKASRDRQIFDLCWSMVICNNFRTFCTMAYSLLSILTTQIFFSVVLHKSTSWGPAIAEGPRNVLRHLKSYQLLHNCTKIALKKACNNRMSLKTIPSLETGLFDRPNHFLSVIAIV